MLSLAESGADKTGQALAAAGVNSPRGMSPGALPRVWPVRQNMGEERVELVFPSMSNGN